MTKKKKKQRGESMQDVEQKPVTEPAEEAADVEQPALDAEAAQEAAKEEAEKAESTQAEEALAAAVAKQEEYLAMAQRVQADFENFRRRNQNVRKEAFDDGARSFATTLLPVIDNLERAILAAAESPDESLRSGVEMVHRQLCEAFEKRGITPIDRLGERFDPNLENAVMQGAPEDGEPGTVCAVLQKGYQMEGMVLRHAMVKVVPE
ncbi:MAG: nucleotide exchange factor GrpE [Clostridiales bacterium]|nr:nucleotide exchange factor GrpE [Clostridiales bacterium]